MTVAELIERLEPYRQDVNDVGVELPNGDEAAILNVLRSIGGLLVLRCGIPDEKDLS